MNLRDHHTNSSLDEISFGYWTLQKKPEETQNLESHSRNHEHWNIWLKAPTTEVLICAFRLLFLIKKKSKKKKSEDLEMTVP